MDKVEVSDTINGKTFRCIFIFDEYSERKYKKDFEEFVEYQTKASLTGEKGETDQKFYNLREYPYIPYETFREYTVSFFSRAMFQMMRANPDFILSDELNLQLRLKRVPGWSYFFETMDEAMDAENACFTAAGIWFLQNIVAPFNYFRKINYTIISRFFLHELTHYVDYMKKLSSWDTRYEAKIKVLARKKSAYCLNYLYTSLFNLREEGLADFVGRKDSPKMDLSVSGMREYNENLRKLSRMLLKKEAEEFYEHAIGFENMTPSSEYVVGRNMCLTIAMAIAKKTKKPYNIMAGKKMFFGYEYTELDKLLSSNDVIYIINLPGESFGQAKSMIEPRPHYYFLRLYEDACDELGISEKNRAMTRHRFLGLVKDTIKNAVEQKKRRLRRAGFAYSEDEGAYAPNTG